MTKTIQKLPVKRLILHMLCIIAGLTVGLQSPPAGLTPAAMHALGIFSWAICAWVLAVLPDYVVALILCLAWVASGSVPFKTAFSTFSSDTWWLLVGALGMGVAVAKTGLLHRLSLKIMRFFPFTYRGQVLGMLLSGVLVAPLIPSITSKVAIIGPFSLAVSDNMGLDRKSPGAVGIFAAMFTGSASTAPLFLSASFMGYVLVGILPAAEQAHFSWTQWFLAALPWGMVLLVASFGAILLIYGSKQPLASTNSSNRQNRELGPMTWKEKITVGVLMAALLLWISEPWHHISAAIVALASISILLGVGIYDRETFRNEIPWDALIFIGAIFSMGPVFSYLQIDAWLGKYASEWVAHFIASPYILTVILAVGIYLLRYVLVSQLVCIALFTVLFTPMALQAGISPWVIGFIIYCATNVWNAFYQNSTFMVAFYSTGGEMVTHRQMIVFSITYMIICLAGLLISVPYWKYLALIK